MVLADIDRALAALADNPYDQGLQLTDASERVLSGLLALAGIVSENMVRDPGWYMLDSGRGLERALQVLGSAPGDPRAGAVGRHRTAGDRSRADGVGVDRHLPPALPRAGRGRGRRRAAGHRPAQPALGRLPAAPDADRPAGDPEHLADRPAAAPAGQPGRAGQDRRPGAARRDRRRHCDRRWATSSGVCRVSFASCPRRSGISTSSSRPLSSRCSARAASEAGDDQLPDRAPDDLHLRLGRDRQLRPVPSPAAGPGLAALRRPRDQRRPGAGRPVPALRPLRQHQVLLPRGPAAHHADDHRDQRRRGGPAGPRSRCAGGAVGVGAARPPVRPAGRLGGHRLHLRVAVRGDPARDLGVRQPDRSRPGGRSARRRPT